MSLAIHYLVKVTENGAMFKIMKEMLQDVGFSFSSTNLAQRSASNEMDFKTEAFTGMNSLQLLLLNNVQINGDFEDFPKNLSGCLGEDFL